MCICNIAPSLFLFFEIFISSSFIVLSIFFSRTSSVFLPSISLSYFPFISLHHFILYATIPQKFQWFSNSFFITMVEFSLLFLYQSETIYRLRKTKICQEGWNSMKQPGIQTSTFLGVSMSVWWLVCYISPKWLLTFKELPKYIQNLQINLDALGIPKMIKISQSSIIPPKPLKWSK